MHIDKQSRPEMAPIARRLQRDPVAILITQDAEGLQTGRPMRALHMDHEGAFWFAANGRATMCPQQAPASLAFVDHDTALYVFLTGQCDVVSEALAPEALQTIAAMPWLPPACAANKLLKFTPATARYWDASVQGMVDALARPGGMTAGSPRGLGRRQGMHRTPASPRRAVSDEPQAEALDAL